MLFRSEAARFYAKEALDLYGLEVRPFASVAEMKAAMPEVEAVDVTTDTGSHHRAVMACLEHDLHVLCEKPLAITTGACDLVIAEATRRGRVLSVAENFRRDPINRLIRALIDDGAIGEPRLMIETTIGGANRILITPWRHMKHTGAITLDEGVHHADILRYYLGEVHTVYGETRLHERCASTPGRPGQAASMPSTSTPSRTPSNRLARTPSTPTCASSVAP